MMHNMLFLLFTLTIFLTSKSSAQITIDVVYPKEGQTVTASDSTFIFGSVNPSDVQFSINDKNVKLYPNGAFLTMLPVDQGNFSFVCVAISKTDTITSVSNVYIPYFFRTSSTNPLIIDTSYVFPREDWELSPGDVFKVAFKGSPGYRANFSIENIARNLPMTEIPPQKSFYWGEAAFGEGTPSKEPPVAGIYTGAYIIQPWHYGYDSDIRFTLLNSFNDTVTYLAPGKLSIDNSNIPKIGELSEKVTIAQTGPRLGYQLFLPKGVRVWITGRRGNYLRVRLSEIEEVWVKKDNVNILPPGTQLPEGIVSVIRTKGFPQWTRVIVFLEQKLPFRIEQIIKPAALLVTLYGVTANTDWIKLDFDDPLIREIRWEQKARNVYQIKIDLNLDQQWGYDPFYENGNFIIDIKKPPEIAGWPASPLKNIVVCLDPGHSPDLGAIGPTRLTEKDANYELCLLLQEKLQDKGAFVFLTREKEDGVSLYTRPLLAKFIGADILLSIHFNALPDGVNAFKNRGASTYYYHPQSYKLAHLIQRKLLKKTRLNNYGLYYDNLALCRPTQMISVLTEPAFIMHPEEETLIRSPKYLRKVVNGIVEAMEEFLKTNNE